LTLGEKLTFGHNILKTSFQILSISLFIGDDNGIREKHFEESGVYPDLVLDLLIEILLGS